MHFTWLGAMSNFEINTKPVTASLAHLLSQQYSIACTPGSLPLTWSASIIVSNFNTLFNGAGSQAEVGIIMGSDSDLSTMRAAAQTLQSLGVKCEVTIVSAHRTPERMMSYARSAHTRGLKVGMPTSNLGG